MANLTADKNLLSKPQPQLQSYPMAATTTIYKGALVCINTAGYAVTGVDTASFDCVGIAAEQMANAGSAGALSIKVESGRAFLLDGSSLTQAMVDNSVYITDDHTVQGTVNTNGTKAGRLVQFVSATQGWVFIPFGGVSRGIVTTDAVDLATSEALVNAIKASLNKFSI